MKVGVGVGVGIRVDMATGDRVRKYAEGIINGVGVEVGQKIWEIGVGVGGKIEAASNPTEESVTGVRVGTPVGVDVGLTRIGGTGT